ncbi:MAG: hypothetical protein JOY80_01155 [Candidatus Dormibacteraeota bacterium]|nr:hypothetical protein [Candidatus Dormibacteraeota bacterium]
MPDHRPRPRAHQEDRGPAQPPRPFRPGPRPDFTPLLHTLRLRNGEREIEVSGSAGFIRQMLDDLPDLWARLEGRAPSQPASIRMPRSPSQTALAGVGEDS